MSSHPNPSTHSTIDSTSSGADDSELRDTLNPVDESSNSDAETPIGPDHQDPDTADAGKASRAGLALTAGAVVLSAISIPWSALALPALLLTVIAAAQASGRTRIVALAVAGPLSLIACSIFALQHAAQGIVESGKRAAEDKAVARLRELHWAQDRARIDAVCDFDGDGIGDYAFIGSLNGEFGEPCAGGKPLRIESFRAIEATDGARVYRGDGFHYAVYLPNGDGGWAAEGEYVDRSRAPKQWIAYAWPANSTAGLRAFFIDQHERICETVEEQVFTGLEPIPATAGPIDSTDCDSSQSEVAWRPWKGKQPRR